MFVCHRLLWNVMEVWTSTVVRFVVQEPAPGWTMGHIHCFFFSSIALFCEEVSFSRVAFIVFCNWMVHVLTAPYRYKIIHFHHSREDRSLGINFIAWNFCVLGFGMSLGSHTTNRSSRFLLFILNSRSSVLIVTVWCESLCNLCFPYVSNCIFCVFTKHSSPRQEFVKYCFIYC